MKKEQNTCVARMKSGNFEFEVSGPNVDKVLWDMAQIATKLGMEEAGLPKSDRDVISCLRPCPDADVKARSKKNE